MKEMRNFEQPIDPEKGFSRTKIQLEMGKTKSDIQSDIASKKLNGVWTNTEENLATAEANMAVDLALMINNNPMPKKACPAFINVRPDMEDIFDATAKLYLEDFLITEIWMDGMEQEEIDRRNAIGEPVAYFPGFSNAKESLVKRGIPSEIIFPTGFALNTPDEHKELLKLVKEKGWDSVITIANHYQAMRIHRGLVRMMKETGIWVKNYYAHVPTASFSEPVLGASGKTEGARVNQYISEYDRNIRYGCKTPPDLASLEESLNYFLFREEIANNKLERSLRGS